MHDNVVARMPYDIWAVECNKGWEKLYLPLIAQCEQEFVPIHQVKEKFGGLRFYVGGHPSTTLLSMIDTAELMSYKTCEWCGETGKMRNKTYWLKVLCDPCSDKRDANKDNLELQDPSSAT